MRARSTAAGRERAAALCGAGGGSCGQSEVVQHAASARQSVWKAAVAQWLWFLPASLSFQVGHW